jgi:8-oxo-dGTP pyrophosphatase MutT (NUDIX family)
LRDALRETLRSETAEGPLAIVSSDVPGVPHEEIKGAFDALAGGADIVLGPALDGGYWLIAMAAFHDAPFTQIPWSTPACLAVTLRRAAEAGLRVHLLRSWIDIDTGVDLSLAVHDPPGPIATRSARVLTTIAAEVEVPLPPGVRLKTSDLGMASPWRSFVHDRLTGADGRSAEYSYLAVPRAVFVVAVTRDREVLLVRQYRHPVRDWTLEVPAGTVEDGESARQAAERELAEEAGATGGTWRHLGTFFSSSAHLSLRSDGFLVTDVDVGEAHPDDDEELFVVRQPLAEVLARARAGGFVEGQTALVLLLAAVHLDGAGPV